MKRVIYKTLDLSCHDCEERVKTLLNALDGVLDCEVSAIDNRVVCEFDEKKLTIEQIADAIRKIDYHIL